jgi:hypothetical protein
LKEKSYVAAQKEMTGIESLTIKESSKWIMVM